jgi:hypothetical protein
VRYQFEVIDCAEVVNGIPRCVEDTPGPIELHVTGDYGYRSTYFRLRCNGVEVPPDLAPKSNPYATPCD